MRSQKGRDLPELTDEDARACLERLRWPGGRPPCIRCGCADTVYRLQGKATRPGLFKCRACKGQFTVTVGTVMEDSHLPLATWVKAFHMVVSSKTGIGALQLQRNLALGSYKTAWHLAHRARYAMGSGPLAATLKGDVRVDESHVGGKRRATPGRPREYGRGTSKAAVLVMVETDGTGRVPPGRTAP